MKALWYGSIASRRLASSAAAAARICAGVSPARRQRLIQSSFSTRPANAQASASRG